jgi:hypothetical protein
LAKKNKIGKAFMWKSQDSKNCPRLYAQSLSPISETERNAPRSTKFFYGEKTKASQRETKKTRRMARQMLFSIGFALLTSFTENR